MCKTSYKPRYLDEAWPERWFFKVARFWPTRLRRLPWFRKFYWQQYELDAARERAREIADRLDLR